MLTSTNGIILKRIKHSDSSAVVHIFTEKYGRRAYFLRGLSKKKNSPRAIIFPLALVEIQSTERENKSLQYIKDIQLTSPLPRLLSNPSKSSIALLLTEILEKSLVENYQNSVLYQFLENAIQLLDSTDKVKNFHIWFLIKLTKHFGFYPDTSQSFSRNQTFYFNLDTGSFHHSAPLLEAYAEPNISALLFSCLGMNFDEMMSLTMSTQHRAALLRSIIDYYKVHISHLNHVASLDVLETVFE